MKTGTAFVQHVLIVCLFVFFDILIAFISAAMLCFCFVELFVVVIQLPASPLLSLTYDIELHGNRGEPIWVRTRSSHCSGPFKCNSIQHGVEVTVCRLYSAPHPLTKDILIVHILVSW